MIMLLRTHLIQLLFLGSQQFKGKNIMPLTSDWDTFTDGFGTITIDHFTADPIVGGRSVRLQTPSHAGSPGETSRAAIMLKEPPHDRDLVLGVIQTLVKAQATPRRFGVFCMTQSATNPSLAASECYVLAQGSFSTSNFHLARVSGFSESSPTLDIFDTGIADLSAGEIRPLQLKWKSSLTIFGGVQFEISFGNLNDTNFSNLAVITTVTDASAGALFTSDGEGCFASNLDQLEDSQIIFDQTSISETVIV